MTVNCGDADLKQTVKYFMCGHLVDWSSVINRQTALKNHATNGESVNV